MHRRQGLHHLMAAMPAAGTILREEDVRGHMHSLLAPHSRCVCLCVCVFVRTLMGACALACLCACECVCNRVCLYV